MKLPDFWCPLCCLSFTDLKVYKEHKNIHNQIEKGIMPPQSEEELIAHSCGATSSKVADYAQIPHHALKRLADRLSFGEKKHGRDNWKKGLKDKSYLIDRLNHTICHIYTLIDKLERDDFEGIKKDDDASAIMWGGMFACEATREIFEK